MDSYLVGVLKEGRQRKGLKQKEVADRLGIKPSTLSGYENGTSEPDIDTYMKMLRMYDLDYVSILNTAYDLMPNDDIVLSADEKDLVLNYRSLEEEDKRMISKLAQRLVKEPEEEEAAFPMYIEKKYFYGRPSAGNGSEVFDTSSMIRVKETKNSKDCDFILQVDGDSMLPKFKNGDLVTVKKADEVRPNNIGIFVVDGQVYIKQVQKGRLHSLNPIYPDIEIKDFDEVYCIGKVTGKAEI